MAMRPNMFKNGLVQGRIEVNEVPLQYRAMLREDGRVYVGTIHPIW